MDYQSRTADAQLASMLAGLPAILIEGVRAVGKTETARRVCADEMLLDDPNVYEMVRNNPFAAVTGWREPLLVDEWQHIGPVFDGVRRQVDEDYRPGRFVLTGSARPERITAHSGAGRIAVLRMRPMTLPERGAVVPQVSLSQLLEEDKDSVGGRTEFGLDEYAEEMGLSGFPGIRLRPGASRMQISGYIENIIQRDIEVSGYRSRKPESLRRWMEAFAAVTSTTASLEKVRGAATRGDGSAPSRRAALDYYEALGRLWVVDDLPGWTPTMDKLSSVNQTPKRHLADPALALALLNREPSSLTTDREFFGKLFESLVALTVRVFAQAANAGVFHLRTKGGRREVDFIVETGEGRVLALEAKLSRQVEDGDVDHLHWLRNRLGSRWIDGAVINTGSFAHRRQDGIAVIPLALLGP